MGDISLMPNAGMNTVGDDDSLKIGGKNPRVYVRDAVNIDVSAAGTLHLRDAVRKVTAFPYQALWQSPLHGDTFGVLNGEWCRIDPLTWTAEELVQLGAGDTSHEVLNNLVCVAGPAGIFTFDGNAAQRLTLSTPPAPMVDAGVGSLSGGTFGVAVAWLRGEMESATSEMTSISLTALTSLEITLPLSLDDSVTGVRLYLTKPGSGVLQRAGDYPLDMQAISVPLLPELGRATQFQHLSPMPTGKFLKYWRGRLLTAKGNILRFSEALTYHLHNERHGFVQMPQRITFVQPVEGGIWIGQVDHVAFLDGVTPDALTLSRKSARAPVPGSAVLVDQDTIGAELAAGGAAAVVWLAENGYVAGTAGGAAVELQPGRLSGIAGQAGTSVVLDRRLLTTVV